MPHSFCGSRNHSGRLGRGHKLRIKPQRGGKIVAGGERRRPLETDYGSGLQPFIVRGMSSWGVAPGFYGVTLSILIPMSVIGRWNSTIAFL